jgi:hypothetical protein
MGKINDKRKVKITFFRQRVALATVTRRRRVLRGFQLFGKPCIFHLSRLGLLSFRRENLMTRKLMTRYYITDATKERQQSSNCSQRTKDNAPGCDAASHTTAQLLQTARN